MKRKSIILSAILLLGSLHTFGQESRNEVSVSFPVGSGVLDTSYGDNAERLSEIISYLGSAQNDGTIELVEVEFCGSASPEGSIAINRGLAAKRVAALEDYVRSRVDIPDSIITRCSGFIDWGLLADMVEHSDMPYKDDALNVIRNVPEFTYNNRGVLVDSRKKHLMDLHGGRTWKYMYKNFFSKIRNATSVIVTVMLSEEPEEEVVEQSVEVIPPVEPADTVVVVPAVVEPEPVADERSPFYMALKTNMLYDLLAVPNIGVEFYLGKNWSVSANWAYGWWDSNNRHRYWRYYGGEIAVRRWFGKAAEEKPLTGHHLGLYGQLFTYDFEWGGKGYMGGKPGDSLWDSPNYAAGIEYGYSLPIARRLNIDFTIGVGYWGGKYYKYIPLDGHYVWQATRNRHWFGPTKAEISLVWLIGYGNTNNK